MSWIKGISKLVIAIAPALTSVFDWLKQKADPKNKATNSMLKEQIKEEKYEDKLKRYCVAYFIEGNTKYEEKIKSVLKKLI